MLPVKLNMKGIGPYEDETIDFASVPGGVVAIIGENGAGKTFLVDSIFAALYRKFPYRDNFYRYCREKAQITFDFKIESVDYRSVININSKKREMEPWLFRDGVALTDGKNGTFDEAIEKLCGCSELILSSVFAAQEKKGSFASLPKAKRKELFIEMLGLGKLQVISDRATEREKITKDAYDKIASKADAYRMAAVKKDIDLSDLHSRLETARGEVVTAEADIKLNTFEIGLLRAKVQNVKEIEARQFPIRKRKQSVTKEIAETARAISESEILVAGLSSLQELASRYDLIEKELNALRAESGTLSGQKADHHKKMTAYTQSIRELEGQLRAQQETVRSVGMKLNRAGADAAIIGTVPCGAEGECAKCQFLVNAVKARDDVDNMTAQIDEAQAAELALMDKVKGLPRPDTKNLTQIDAQLSNVVTRIGSLEKDRVISDNARAKLIKAEAAASIIDDLSARLVRLHDDGTHIDEELAELDASLKLAKESEADLRSAEIKLDLEQEALGGARQHLNNLLAETNRAEVEVDLAKKAQIELDVINLSLGGLDQDRKSWSLLAKAFGKTGIQSLEIDASGPAVSEITNDLLFSCFGPRFSIRFVTQVLKDDKSGYKDDFDIYVMDAENNREGSIDDLSGGEKVIVCEGVSLAIALFNRSRSNVGWCSLFRDEATSAIDDKRAPLYIQMLRRAREQGHFERLFFIAHQKRVTEGADSKVLVANGHVTLE